MTTSGPTWVVPPGTSTFLTTPRYGRFDALTITGDNQWIVNTKRGGDVSCP